MKYILTLLVLLLAVSVRAGPLVKELSKDKEITKDTPKEKAPLPLQGNKVVGLELPPDQTVDADEGFIVIEAICAGEVSFTVIGAKKADASGKSVTIAVNSKTTQVLVLAVALVDGHLTQFARSVITVKQSPLEPPTGAEVSPKVLSGTPKGDGRHVTFVCSSEEQRAVTEKLRLKLEASGWKPHVYLSGDPIISQKKLDGFLVNGAGVVVQTEDGSVTLHEALPADEAGVITLLRK